MRANAKAVPVMTGNRSLDDEGVSDGLKHARECATEVQGVLAHGQRPEHDVVPVGRRREDAGLRD
jgi:hypothetical protein